LKSLERRDLTVGVVAERHGVTPRYVQKLLEREGTTYSEFVQNSRLARVHAGLLDTGSRHRSISDIAFDAGFGDISHFNHAFRRRYGASPSDIRNRDTQQDNQPDGELRRAGQRPGGR
jgi:AraC-like DNA-binding protein